MHSQLKPEDEEIHRPEKDKYWQESWYFNWADTSKNIFGLTRIGLRFNENRTDGLVLTIKDGKPHFIYPAVNIPYNGEIYKASDGITAKGLKYKMKKPFKKWTLILDGRSHMKLDWEAFTPPHDFHTGGDLPPNVAGSHFEQSGCVNGYVCFKGREIKINALGQRDKSWGTRDWSGIEGWSWISAQFNEEFSFNVWQGSFQSRIYNSGFVFIKGKNYPVENIDIKYTKRGLDIPVKADIEITYNKNKKMRVSALSAGRFPLMKNSLWVQEIYAVFSADTDKKTMQGAGIIEYARHAGAKKILLMPGFIGSVVKGILP